MADHHFPMPIAGDFGDSKDHQLTISINKVVLLLLFLDSLVDGRVQQELLLLLLLLLY